MKHITENPSLQIYPNKIKNSIVYKIKTGYKLELLTPETMRFLGSTKKDAVANKNSENVPKLESVESILVHCNLVNNNYQQASKVLFTFVPTQTIWTANKYCTTFVNNAKHDKYRIFIY